MIQNNHNICHNARQVNLCYRAVADKRRRQRLSALVAKKIVPDYNCDKIQSLGKSNQTLLHTKQWQRISKIYLNLSVVIVLLLVSNAASA